MKEYKVIQNVMLTFLTPQDSFDATIKPGDGVLFIKDGDICIRFTDGIIKRSITSNNALRIWEEDGKIAII